MPNVSVAVIGGGITASLIGYLSRDLAAAAAATATAPLNIDVWESEEELGGRMKTMKSGAGRGVDIGAQYITTAAETCQSSEIYSSLLKSGEIKPLTGEIVGMKRQPSAAAAVNYVAPRGMQSLVQHFANLSNFRNVYAGRAVRELNVDDRGQRVQVVDENGRPEIYDAVVLTPPIPAILELEGNFKSAIPDRVYEKLRKVEYSCRDCLALFFCQELPVSWAAKYLTDDDVFRYVAIQENKASDGGTSSSSSSVVFHTSIQFGEKYKSTDDQVTTSLLVEHARRLFPTFPQPVEIRHHKWRYSQVTNAYEDRGVGCIVIREKPLVIIAGDAFTASNFDGCVASAQSVAETLNHLLVQSSLS